MSIVLQSTGGGSVTINEPTTASNFTQTLPAGTGTIAVQGASTNIVSGTAVASTSGTSIDFTGIPSWVKRITVMFNGVSTNGTSGILVQIGNTTFTTTGYNSAAAQTIGSSTGVASSSAGFVIANDTATDTKNGQMVISLVGSNIYVSSHTTGNLTGRTIVNTGGGSVTLSAVLDRVRITTVNGTDTFDAGSINILYE